MANPKKFLITISGSIEVFEDEIKNINKLLLATTNLGKITVEQAIDFVRENITIDEMIAMGNLEITGKEKQ